MGMGEKFFSASLTSSAGGDLLDQMKTLGIFSVLRPLKVTIIADAELAIKINEVGDVYSPLYPDTADTKWKISLSGGDVLISSITTEEANVDIWVGIVGIAQEANVDVVWVLSSSVTPQPANIVGAWDDSETWDDSAVWYD